MVLFGVGIYKLKQKKNFQNSQQFNYAVLELKNALFRSVTNNFLFFYRVISVYNTNNKNYRFDDYRDIIHDELCTHSNKCYPI